MKTETHSTSKKEDLAIDQPYKKLEISINEIDKIKSIGSDIISVSTGALDSLIEEAKSAKQYELSRKIERVITMLENIDTSGTSLGKKIAAIRNQSLVLLITNFERFLNEFTIMLVENYSYLIEWPEKKSSIDLGAFRYGTPTVGEIVLRSLREKYNFQDLQSILAFAKELLRVTIKLKKEDREKIIQYHAKRHALVHNSGIVDDKLQKQIRNLECSCMYSNGDIIEITEDEYNEARQLLLSLAEKIYKDVRSDMAPF